MKHRYLFSLLLLLLLVGCKSPHKMKAGTISLEVFVYNDPEKNLYNSYRLPISTLYFLDNDFIEKVPPTPDSMALNNYAYIQKGLFIKLDNLSGIKTIKATLPLSAKKFGAVFVDKPVPFYEKREELRDTVFNGYNYRRVRIVTGMEYSVFYIHQVDSVIPYSLAPQFDKDYHGILNRIDSYDKVNGRFISLRMKVTPGIPELIYKSFKN